MTVFQSFVLVSLLVPYDRPLFIRIFYGLGNEKAKYLEKYNCRTTFGRSSHNGLLPTGLSAVLLTVQFLLDYLCYDMFHEL